MLLPNSTSMARWSLHHSSDSAGGTGISSLLLSLGGAAPNPYYTAAAHLKALLHSREQNQYAMIRPTLIYRRCAGAGLPWCSQWGGGAGPACCPPSSVGKVLLPPVRAPWSCRLGSHARRAGPPPDAWRRRHRTGRMAGLPAAHGHRTQAPCWARVTARLRARQADRHAPHPQHYTCTLPICARMLAKKPLGLVSLGLAD